MTSLRALRRFTPTLHQSPRSTRSDRALFDPQPVTALHSTAAVAPALTLADPVAGSCLVRRIALNAVMCTVSTMAFQYLREG